MSLMSWPLRIKAIVKHVNITAQENFKLGTSLTGEDHVHVVLHTEPEIGLVLLRKSGEIDIGVGEIDALAGRDATVVPRLDLDGLVVHNLEHIKGQDTVVDVDNAPGLDDLGDVLVVNIPRGLSTIVIQTMKRCRLTCSWCHTKWHTSRRW